MKINIFGYYYYYYNNHWYTASVDCISTIRNSLPLIIAYNRNGSFRPSAAALGQLLCKIYSREDGSNMEKRFH